MATTRNNQADSWKDGFLFVGNQLALDFLNTCPVQNGEPKELLPDFDALLHWFRAAGLIGKHEAANLQRHWNGSTRASRTIEEMWRLREELRKKVLTWQAGGDVPRPSIDKLNTLLTSHPMLARLMQAGNGLRLDMTFEARAPEDLFAPLAYSAAKLFAEADRTRVRKCGQCVLHFLDTSKKGSRRWCSMQLCGNRIKVAAYARRKRLVVE